jgi:hypothetical protein
MKDPIADRNDTFNIENMLNENWRKIDEKVVLKEEGKGLSTNDYSNEEKAKVAEAAPQTSLNAHTSDTTVHITQAERNAWNGKLDESEVATSGANKVLRLDANGKGAISITGDAASVGGQTLANLDTRFVKTANMDLGALQVRINNGQWEINDGTGWKSMSAVKSIQRGTVDIYASGGTGTSDYPATTVNIAAVNQAKSVIEVDAIGIRAANNKSYGGSAIGVFSSNTQIVLTPGQVYTGTNADFVRVSWQVIEYV